MDAGRILKWVVIIVIAVVGWKYVSKVLNKPAVTSGATGGSGGPCVSAAAGASEKWGSGLARFVNPPYDVNAWSSFHGDVNSAISEAESQCSCADESCRTARSAMSDLRSLTNDLDRSIRNGSSVPDDVVQRQERVDQQIDNARASAQTGR